MQSKFEDLKVGDKFLRKGIEYTKVKTVWKDCCTVKYNAIDTAGNKKAISPHKIVEIINGN